MSKKKNKKFKKSSQPIQKSSLSTKEIKTETTDISPSLDIQEKEEKMNDKDEIEILNEKYLPIQKDVHKLLVVLGCLAILFAGIYFLGAKTNILNNIGNWVYNISNIQTQ